MSTSRTLVLENLPPVVRITFENGTITLTAQNPESSLPPENLPTRSQSFDKSPDNPPSDGKSEPSSFQITSPGWYVMRNGRKVELRPRQPSDWDAGYPSACDLDYSWFAVDPDRDFPCDATDVWPCDSSVRSEPGWTTAGAWVSFGFEYEYDVVSGPLVVPSPVDPSPVPSDSSGCAGCGQPLNEQDSCPACVEERVATVPHPDSEEEDDYPCPVPCVPPVVGHRFRMRNGEETEVVSQDSHYDYPFNGSNGHSWTITGYEFRDHTSIHDLVEDLGPVPVPEPVPVTVTTPTLAEPFQIKTPGWYRLRNGTLVELRARTSDDSHRHYAYQWFAVDVVRDVPNSRQPSETQGYDAANVRRHAWWRTDGSYVDLSTPSNLWCDIVSGPFPAPVPEPVPEPVRTFPSWLHRDYNFVARDANGTWYAYGKRPVADDEIYSWDPQDDECWHILSEEDLVDPSSFPSIVPDVPWYEALIERPNSEPSITS